MFSKILKQIIQHKFLTTIILLALLAGGYFGYQWLFGNKSTTQYVTAAVEKGTIISSISGTGQVSASDQIDVKPKVSGDVVYVDIKIGQEVKAGALIAQIDSRDAEKAARDAETALETANLELDNLLEPADELTLLQAENSLIQTKESKQKAEDNVVKAYEDGFYAVVSAFSDLPTIMTETENIIYGKDINKYQDNIAAYFDMVKAFDEKRAGQYKNETVNSYQAALAAYNKNFQNYRAVSRYSDNAIIEALIDETYETAKRIAEAIKNTDNLISFVKDTLTQQKLGMPAITSSHQSAIKTNAGKANSIISNLLSVRTTIKSNREAILSAERSIEEKELSLAKLKAGPDNLAVRAKKIAIQQKEDALLSARQNLADYYIRVPFDALVAKVNIKKGDSISSGSAVATLITKQKIAEITLNEIDVAKVKAGQKATLTFDAIDGLVISGAVAEIDTIGTVTQGVVNYNVKISFDTQDERVKPGMSVSAAVITDIKQNVLLVSNSAIKSSGSGQYVEVLVNNAPQSRSVETGLSNDTMSEIISGLEEGEKVVTQTITGNTSTQTGTQNSGLRIPGMGGFGR